MLNLDFAEQKFKELVAEIGDYEQSIFTEQDTRIKIIDRIFVEVLGWSYETISTEEQAGSGFLDYKFTSNGLARLIVEAKRDGREFELSHAIDGNPYKLKGSLFKNINSAEGIKQAIIYGAYKGAELACVTNGREWIIFRCNRYGDGKEVLEGKAFIFTSLLSIIEKFKIFYQLLAYESVQKNIYRALFQEAEGVPIRSKLFMQSIKDPHECQMLDRDPIARDIDKVMLSFFNRLRGDNDPKIILECFVETRESEDADQRLIRISRDFATRIHSLDTADGSEIAAAIERVKLSNRNEFILIIGSRSAGKSTFIERFFDHVIDADLRAGICVARVDIAKYHDDPVHVADWLDRKLLDALESAIFNDMPATYEDIMGMFWGEYQRMSSGTLRHLYESDKEDFKLQFGRHIEKRREEQTHDFICKLIRHISRGRKKVPCIILDNADHHSFEFQEKVFQYARSIYESEICLMIMPITDKTSWQVMGEEARESFECEVLYLPTPPIRKVLQRRITYLKLKLDDEDRIGGSGYFIGRGIGLSIRDLKAFVNCIQQVFVTSDNSASLIENLSNHDIRHGLDLSRKIVTSPYIKMGDLLSAYLLGNDVSLSRRRVMDATIKQEYSMFPGNQNDYVFNIYDAGIEGESSPLMGIRILQMMYDVNSERKLSYISKGQIISYFGACTVEPRVVINWLQYLLRSGMCQGNDPTKSNIDDVDLLRITPSGNQHLLWGLGITDLEYLFYMLDVTRLVDEAIYNSIIDELKKPKPAVYKILQHFVGYLLNEDKIHVHVPEHESYQGQRNVDISLKRLLRKDINM